MNVITSGETSSGNTKYITLIKRAVWRREFLYPRKSNKRYYKKWQKTIDKYNKKWYNGCIKKIREDLVDISLTTLVFNIYLKE